MHTPTHHSSRIKETIKLYVLLILIGVAAIVATLFFDVNICPVYRIFGIPCPACGMTRAFTSLPDIRQALSYHPLFVLIPFMPLLPILPEKRRNIVSIILIILFLGVWVARMLLLFPHTIPMVYNENSLLEFIRIRLQQ